ncbi:MAG: hypothetical protein SGARI_004822 [Bacillariaceae sp.]
MCVLLFGLLCFSRSIFGMLMFMDVVLFFTWPVMLFFLGEPDIVIMLTSVVNFLLVSALQFFLFTPKILHVIEEKRSGPEHNTVVVTGLNGDNENVMNVGQNGYTDSQARRSTGVGEIILTTKSKKELLQEIHELQERLKVTLEQYNQVQEENNNLREKIRNNGDDAIKDQEDEPKGDATAETADSHDGAGPS